MLVVGSGGNMIKEELDRKKMAELVRDIRTRASLAGRIGHRHLIPPQTGYLCLDCDRSYSSGSTALIAHRLASRFLGFGYQESQP
jgi:hypothetical protein